MFFFSILVDGALNGHVQRKGRICHNEYFNVLSSYKHHYHKLSDGLSSRFIMERCSVLNEINCPVENGYWLFCLFYVTQLCTSILLSS